MGRSSLAPSLQSFHACKPLIPLVASSLASKLYFPKRANCKPGLASVYRARTLVQVSWCNLNDDNPNMKATREMQYKIRSTSASMQHGSEEIVDDKPKDLSVSGDSICRQFLEFYASCDHKVLPIASLVPDDPTVLLTIAGMLQFKPIFLGKAPRQVPCATTAQRCIRTNDVENVGWTARHHTFFEMLGNFSFGDYFKRDAINWAWEPTTKEYTQNFYC